MTRHQVPSSSSFTGDPWTYDVFLSFRGEDTRNTFTGNLYNSLRQRGIHTFIDDAGLRKGEKITPALLEAIQESRIAIVVFSENYASSTFCLDELVNILEHLKGEGRLVWPVFCDVDPSDVRHQRGSYGKALAKLEERFRDNKEIVKKWREALSEAANLSGFHFQQRFQSEYKFISGITEELSKKINRALLHVADHPVGLESSIQEVNSLLGVESNERVNMVGIYGIGGVGKTTLARAVYNLIGDQFEGLCFLADIREKAINKHGLVELQETLLSELVGEKDIKLGDVNRGIPMIKRRLQQKKVLLILDDVDNLKQLKAIAGGHDWFGSGSRIIITTRNKQLLISHKVVKLYEVKELNVCKSLELFSWNAFKNNKIDPCYVDISNRVVFYTGGLPLALEVIGSYLFGKRLEEWNSLLDKYEKIPNKEVYEILKVSYDSLEDDEKEIFLDIACFFNKYEARYVKEILYTRGFHAEIGIRVLIDKSLIKIDGANCLRMHDLIQDVGREIVRRESTFEPGKRSRLWFDMDILHVLEENTGTNKIEVIMLTLCEDKEVHWNGEAFKKMNNLKILIIENARFSEGPKHLPSSLRVLDWSGYPSLSLPSDFNPKKLLILSLPESCLRIFKPLKMFQYTCFMDFGGCKFLTQIPNLSGLPNLCALCLDNCTNLIRVHDSVGFLYNLRLLSAQGCTRLKVLTPCIRLTSLETLDLRECSSLEFFPKVLEPMENVRDIYLDQTAIKELPFSIENLVGLERLYLRHCARLKQLPSSILMLPKLQVILEYGRRFQLFEGYETKKKVCSEVCLGLMMQYYTRLRSLNKRDLHFCRCLDAYSINTSPTNNFFQIFCVPMALPLFDLVSILKGRYRFNVSIDSLPLSFWFRKEFPKVVLCVIGEPVTGMDCSVLDIKLSVLTNGAEQLSCLWNYTFSTKGEMIKPVTWCGLRSQLNRVISDHEWNHVEVSWELKYHNPHDPHSQNSNPIGIPSRTIESTPIYVFEEENYIRENIRIENPDVSVSGSNNVNRQNTGMDELISLTKLELQDDNKECRNDL